MCSSNEAHYHTCCDDHEDHAAESRNMSCYCYPNPPRYRNGDRSHGHNGWHEDGRGGKKKKKLGGIWDESESKEREKLKEFWLGLGDTQRQSLLRIEKESILREMREQQRHICSCSVCGRRRTVLEEELELLYDAYYSELEDRGDSGEIDIEGIDYPLDEVDLSLSLKAVEGGVLTVADDLLIDDGRKFFSLMEKLADGRAQNGYEQMPDQYGYGEQEGEYEDENYQEEDEELLEEQRIEEGRRMFQMFAAKMFEQRVLAAYREKVALEKQEQLMQEEEEEEKLQAERRENKARKERERKQKKKELKKQQELEKERKRVEKEEEEQALREKEQKEREEKRKEKQRQKEDEKRKKDEDLRRKEKERAELKEKERAKVEKDSKGPGKVASGLAKVASDGGKAPVDKGWGAKSPEKEADLEQNKSGKKRMKKEKGALESDAGVILKGVVKDGELAEGWEIAHGKHKKRPAAVQEQQKEVLEAPAKKMGDEALAALRSSGAARHYEQNGSHQPMIPPPGFLQPSETSSQHPQPPQNSHPPSRQPSVVSPPESIPPPRTASINNGARIGFKATVLNPPHGNVGQEQQNRGHHPGWAEQLRVDGVDEPGNVQRTRMRPEPAGEQLQFITRSHNHLANPPAPLPVAAQMGYVQEIPRLERLTIDVDQELSSSMEHLLPGGLLSATGDTPQSVSVPSGFEEVFGRLQLLEAGPRIMPARDPYGLGGIPIHPPQQETFHDANGHFRQPSGSVTPESLGSPESTWSFGRRPGSGSDSGGELSRQPSGDAGRPWMYTNGGEEHLRAAGVFGGDGSGRASRPQSGRSNGRASLGPIGKAARQDIRISWDGSQEVSGEIPPFAIPRSSSHPALPPLAASSPPGGPLGVRQLASVFPPHWEQPPPPISWGPGKGEGLFGPQLDSAILVLRSAVARQDASGSLLQPLSLSAFWQSLLAIDGSLLNEGITRVQILNIWVELAKQQVVRVGHADPARPNEPFILEMLPPPPPRSANTLGVCLMCNEGLASVQLRPCLHLACVGCTSQLAAQADFGELCCPFCARVVQSSATLGPDGHFLPGEHLQDEPPQSRNAHKGHQMKSSGVTVQRSPRQEATRIDQEWPTLEAAVSVQKAEGRPASGGRSKAAVANVSSVGQSRPASSNGTVNVEASRKSGWGAVPKGCAVALPTKVSAADGTSKAPSHESSAWPPLNTVAKGRRKGSGER